MLPLLLSIAFLLSRLTLAADRTLAAEGDYVAQSNPNKPLAHWKLWHLRNGEYEVQETLAGPTYVVQVFHFDSQFLPNGFSLTIDTDRKRPKALRSKAPWKSYPTIVSCRYTLQDLTCEGENNGKKSASSIVPQQPYVFVPGDFYALDRIWLMTGVVHLTEHNHSENTAVNGIHGKSNPELGYAISNYKEYGSWLPSR